MHPSESPEKHFRALVSDMTLSQRLLFFVRFFFFVSGSSLSGSDMSAVDSVIIFKGARFDTNDHDG